MEQFRDRLINLQGSNDLKALRRELSDFQLAHPDLALPAFVVRSVLRGVLEQVEDGAAPATWEQVRAALGPPLGRVIDATAAPASSDLCGRLNDLVRTWSATSMEL